MAVFGGACRRCAACLLPLAVVAVPPAVVPPVTVVVPPVARVPLAKDEDVRGAARICPTASKDVGSVGMDGGVVGAMVVDSGGGGSGEG